MKRILLSLPHMGGAEEAFVHDAFATNWLSTVGANLDVFMTTSGAPFRSDTKPKLSRFTTTSKGFPPT